MQIRTPYWCVFLMNDYQNIYIAHLIVLCYVPLAQSNLKLVLALKCCRKNLR